MKRWAGLLCFLVGCAHQSDVVPDPPTGDYRLGPDDLIEVAVWKETALSATVPVRPDGKISLPMLGDVAAAGRTTAELRLDLIDRIKKFVPSPEVAVLVKEVRAARIFVLGEVVHPGAFPLTANLTLLQVLAVAGGTTEFARTGRMVLIRRSSSDQSTVRLPIDFNQVLTGRTPPPQLSPGDTIYVP